MLAILLGEPEEAEFRRQMSQATALIMTSVNFWEVLSRAARAHGQSGVAKVELLFLNARVRIVAPDADDARAAAEAFAKYGKGVSPAKLNMGDCFAYALAKRHDCPLLFKGGDFALTDVRRV